MKGLEVIEVGELADSEGNTGPGVLLRGTPEAIGDASRLLYQEVRLAEVLRIGLPDLAVEHEGGNMWTVRAGDCYATRLTWDEALGVVAAWIISNGEKYTHMRTAETHRKRREALRAASTLAREAQG